MLLILAGRLVGWLVWWFKWMSTFVKLFNAWTSLFSKRKYPLGKSLTLLSYITGYSDLFEVKWAIVLETWFYVEYWIEQSINSRRKNTAKAKLKAANQQERIKLWKQHFENLLGNPPKITHEPITRIISKQLDIKLGPFTQEELDSVLRKIKNRKPAGLEEIPPEVWKTRQFDDILLRHCNAVYNQNPIDRWTKGCILPLP